MTGATIAALLVKFGPPAINLIQDLVAVWDKDLTPEEVRVIVTNHRKTEEQYVAQELARRQAQPVGGA